MTKTTFLCPHYHTFHSGSKLEPRAIFIALPLGGLNTVNTLKDLQGREQSLKQLSLSSPTCQGAGIFGRLFVMAVMPLRGIGKPITYGYPPRKN
ncbi:hypothetical protein Tco_1038296 [Tanacetum coccineum]